ncbi:MAG: flagellar hook-basal body complex protein FliE [Alphaproteobacteria bacterium]|nr:flagellar hook-basal body complex protein FliE [Alphaproteobacteria bacterium]
MAANAYSSNQNVGIKGTTNKDDSVSFSDFLEGRARESIETMREGEKLSGQAVTGEADLTDVVEAVTAAELTLETVVAMRDRLVSAFQEIMRMPI